MVGLAYTGVIRFRAESSAPDVAAVIDSSIFGPTSSIKNAVTEVRVSFIASQTTHLLTINPMTPARDGAVWVVGYALVRNVYAIDPFSPIPQPGGENLIETGVVAPGGAYRAIGTIYLPAPQVGSLNSAARTIQVLAFNPAGAVVLLIQSAAAPNEEGVTPLSVDFTVPADADRVYVRYYNGATTGNGVVYWDDIDVIPEAAYFDGSTDFPAASYLGGTPRGASRMVTGERFPYVIETSRMSGNYGPFAASLAVRSRESGVGTVQMVDADDNTVLAVRDLSATDDWERLSLATPAARSVKLVIQATGPIEIDQVLVENASEIYDYFDAYTTPPVIEDLSLITLDPVGSPLRYRMQWLGTRGAAPSRMAWAGGLHLEGEDSEFRPFLASDTGSVDSTTFRQADMVEVPMDVQLDETERRYHDVSVTDGPKIITKHATQNGTAIEVEMILTAENPFAYSNSADVPLGRTQWAPATMGYFAEIPAVIENLYPDPGMTQQDPAYLPTLRGSAVDASFISRRDVNMAVPEIPGKGGYHVRLRTAKPVTASQAVGISLPPVAVVQDAIAMTFSAWVRTGQASNVNVRITGLNESGAVVRTGGLTAVTLRPDAWSLVTQTLYAPEEQWPGVTHLRLDIFCAVGWIFGQVLDAAYMQVTPTYQRLPWFSGASTDDSRVFSYRWSGVPYFSTSLRAKGTVYDSSSLADPQYSSIPTPPRPPIISGSVANYASWRRGYVEIPADDVALWADSVPSIYVQTAAKAAPGFGQTTGLRDLRIRFYANPFGFAPEDVDPDAYCGEFVVSYLPFDTKLFLNGLDRSAYAQIGPSKVMPADHLLFASDGGPVKWPVLSCAIPYIATIDMPVGEPAYQAEVTMVLNRRE